jgi:Protein of unknown function with PCYCGC motif
MINLHFRRWLAVIGFASAFAVGLTGCGAKPAVPSVTGHDLTMAPLSGMPADVQSAPVTVRQAYQFAAANPGMLMQIPCYCGCGAIGHKSNYDCYVTSVDAAGVIKYDTHALGCSLCVDITQDTMRLLREGKSISEIRTYVDGNYAKYGTSNMP